MSNTVFCILLSILVLRLCSAPEVVETTAGLVIAAFALSIVVDGARIIAWLKRK